MGKNKINANIKYYNPNPFSLVLKQIDCKVLLNNGNFTVFKLDTNFTIPANKEFLIPAKLEFQMSDLVKNSMELLLNKPVKLNITGNATLSKGIFTKTVPIAYETTQKLNLGAALSGMK
jgi:LEA14-like dessication related protein